MAVRTGNSQIRQLYVGTGTETSVADGNAIITGNVGIGTSSPGAKLQVKKAIAGNETLLGIEASGAGTTVLGSITYDQSDDAMRLLNNSTFGGTSLRLGTRSNDNLVIDYYGNVGIGTTSPSALLEVDNQAYSASNAIANFVNGNNPVRVVYDTVVIAQTDVTTLSLVETVDGSQANEQKLTFSVGDGNAVIRSTSPVANGIYINVAAANSDPGYLTTSGLNAIRILNNGNSIFNYNVGIGTTSPTAKLDISQGAGGTALNVINSGEVAFRFSTKVEDTSVNTAVFRQGIYYDNTENATIAFYRGDSAVGGFLTFNTYNGQERMRIDASGNVGIGTATPVGKLNVALSADSDGNVTGWGSNQVVFTRGGTSTSQGLGFSVHDANNTATISSLTPAITWSDLHYRALNHAFYSTGSILGIYQNTSGNVGIGETSPSERLHVNGKTYIESQGVNWNETTPGITRGALHFDPVGNGADNTGNAITFGASDQLNGTNAQAGIYTRSDGSYGTKMYFATTDSYVAGSKTRMMIDHIGNVGIGTTGPIAKLHVNATNVLGGSSGDFTILSTLQNSGGSGGNNLYENNWSYRTATGTDWPTWSLWNGISVDASFVTPTTSLTWHWREPNAGKHHFGNGGTNVMTIGPSNVGIGTTNPTDKLTVNGNISIFENKIYNGSASNSAGVSFPSSTTRIDGYNGITFHSSTTTVGSQSERMRITNTGNVGINTTNPQQKLHVVGNTQVDGWIIQGGYQTGSVTLPYPGANYGNGRIYLRLCSSASARIMTAKVRISSTWNWAPAFGSVEAEISFFWNGSSFPYSYVNILSATGQAAENLTFGALEIEGGFVSVPIYSVNSNPIYTYIQLSPDADSSQIGNSGWSSVAFPGRANVYIQTSLGIGTTSPGYPLEIASPSTTSLVYQRTGVSANKWGFHSDNNATYWQNITSGNLLFTLQNGGNVGIGTTSPGAKLDVITESRVSYSSGSEYRMRFTNTDGNGRILVDGNESALIFGTSGAGVGATATERMRITSAGNVGIGITAPSKTLEVAGTGIKLVNAANTHTHLLLDTATYDYKLGDISTSGGAYMQITSSTNQTFIYNSDLILSDGQKITITRSNPADPSCIYVDNTYTSFGTTYNIDSDVSSTLGSRHIGFRYNGTIVGFIGTNGTTAVTYSTTASDERLKKNIEDWQENILDKFEKIEPKEFNFISQEEGEGKTKGFIAQNMAEDFPEAYPHDYSEDKYYSFNPSGMVVYLMKAVKDLVEQNKQLETRIQTLEKQKL